MDPKISVIVPTYNFETYLPECLDSILGQTLRPFEIIVCDDASADGTKDVVAKYASRYPDIFRTIFHPENVGIPRNFNSGLRAARGDYVTLLSGDDYWMPQKLEKEYKALIIAQAKWAYSKISVVAQDRRSSKTSVPFFGTLDDLSGNILKYVFARVCSPRTFLIQRSAIAAIGYFDESLDTYEDWDIKLRLAARYPIAHVPEYMAVYRRHGEGASQRDDIQQIQRITQVYYKNSSLLETLSEEDRMFALKNLFLTLAKKYEGFVAQRYDEMVKVHGDAIGNLPDIAKNRELFEQMAFRVLRRHRQEIEQERNQAYREMNQLRESRVMRSLKLIYREARKLIPLKSPE